MSGYQAMGYTDLKKHIFTFFNENKPIKKDFNGILVSCLFCSLFNVFTIFSNHTAVFSLLVFVNLLKVGVSCHFFAPPLFNVAR